jgi:hypothetical protein
MIQYISKQKFYVLLTSIFFVGFLQVSLGDESITTVKSEKIIDEMLLKIEKAGKVLKEKNFFPVVPPYPSYQAVEKCQKTIFENLGLLDHVGFELTFSSSPPWHKNPVKILWQRRDKLEVFLALIQTSRGIIDLNFNPHVTLYENICPIPDESDVTGQVFLPGMQADDIKNLKTRENYKKACWENANNNFKKQIQRGTNDLISSIERVFRKYVLKTYSEEPRADQELINLLEKYEYPMEERIKLLADLNIPYKGFRNWESTDKLFKAAARFISLDKDEVNLEKADDKKTTIELSVLRKEDQDYVKKQLESKKKTVDDEKVKKD